MGLTGWPSDAAVDDTGTGTDGTPVNKSFWDAAKAAVEDWVASVTNPTIKCKAVIDEVVTARGSKASLDERFDVEHNDDGTQKAGTFASPAEVKSQLGSQNFVRNGEFILWPTVAPNPVVPYWSTSGGAATLTRAGVGEADTTQKIGEYCLKAVVAAGTFSLIQTIYGSDIQYTDFLTKTFQFGCWIKTSTAATVKLVLDDSVGTASSSFHTGGGSWEFLSVSRVIDSGSAGVNVVVSAGAACTFYASGAIALPSDLALTGWRPSPMQTDVFNLHLAGDVTTGTKYYYLPIGAGRLHSAALACQTAPTGSAVLLDLLTPNAAGAFTSMFSTKPQISVGAFSGTGTPGSGTYERRCFRRVSGGTIGEGTMVRVDITADSGNTAADLTISLRFQYYQNHREMYGSVDLA